MQEDLYRQNTLDTVGGVNSARPRQHRSNRVQNWKLQLSLLDQTLTHMKARWQPRQFRCGYGTIDFECIKSLSMERTGLSEDIAHYAVATDDQLREALRIRIECRWIVIQRLLQQASSQLINSPAGGEHTMTM